MTQLFIVPIARPYLGDEEKRAVLEVLSSGELVQGTWVERFEERFAALHDARHAVATSSGTTALTALLLAHDIGPGDEVIVPAFSFFATASSVLSVQARPVFVDVDRATFTLSVAAARAAITPRTRAILAVHLYGHPADLRELASLCREHDILLLQDAAQAHLARIDGQGIAAFGPAALSLYASKNATTGEGGIVLTNDADLCRRLRSIRNHGRGDSGLHETLGFNFRLTNLAAAIGAAQLERLPAWTEKRIRQAAFYDAHLRGVAVPLVLPGFRHVFHQYTVRTPGRRTRDRLLSLLHERGVEARVYYPRPIHQQPAFVERGFGAAHLPVTSELCDTVLSLPVHSQLTPDELALVAREFNRALEQAQAS